MSKELEIIKERLNAKHSYDNANTCIKHLYASEVQAILNAAEELNSANTKFAEEYKKVIIAKTIAENKIKDLERALEDPAKEIAALTKERDELKRNFNAFGEVHNQLADKANAHIDNLITEKNKFESLLKQFLVSLTLCDHMGDVAGGISKIMKELNIANDGDTWEDSIRKWAIENNITTLNGTEMKED